MNFSQRLRLAWDIATGGKAASSLIPTWKDGTPTYPEVSFENMVRHGWRKNELIFACVTKTAESASFISLEARDGKGEPMKDHPLRRLLARPNPFMDEFDFWCSVIVYQKLAGGAYFEKERDRGGRVIALWPLRPDWVRPVKSARAFISGYEYAVPGEEVVTLRVEDVLDFKLFDPLNLYRGYPPAAVAGRVGDVDNATTDYLKLFMEKGGQPPGYLKTKQKLMDVDVSDIRRRWGERYGGYQHWTEPAVLDMDADYVPVGMSFRDMGFDMLDARSEARICMVLQVPAIVVGAKIGLDRSTYSNYAEARMSWWEDTLAPLYRNFESVIANDLANEFGGVDVGFDFSNVPALKESEDAKWLRANEGISRGYVTINEARQIVGLDEIGDPGDIFLRPTSATEVDMNGGGDTLPESSSGDTTTGVTEQQVLNGAQIQSALSIIDAFVLGKLPREVAVFMVSTFFNIPLEVAEKLVPREGAITPVTEPDVTDPVADEPDEDEDLTEEAARFLELEAKARRVPPDDDERRAFEKRLRKGLEAFFEGQLERIEQAVGEQYAPVTHSNGTVNE